MTEKWVQVEKNITYASNPKEAKVIAEKIIKNRENLIQSVKR